MSAPRRGDTRRHAVAGWTALLGALALAVGGGAITEDLRTLFGAHADQIIAAARIVAALVAAGTGAIIARGGTHGPR